MNNVLVLDGGMGKELRRIGAPFRQPEWSALALIEAPEMVVEAHSNFVAAGAELIITNNYAVVPYHHPSGLFEERGRELTELAGMLARRAAERADRRVLVAGSMPPLFGSYEPDNVDSERAAPIYRMIAETLETHVDLWIAETLSTIAEMESIVDAIDAVGSARPIWVSFSLPDEAPDPDVDAAEIHLRSGQSLAEVVDAIESVVRRRVLADGSSAPIEAVLVNCSLPERTGPALAELRRLLDRHDLGTVRTGGYANAFPTHRDHDYQANEVIFERREELTADRYSDIVQSWVDDGATIVGGCCDMYPEHIAALAERFAR